MIISALAEASMPCLTIIAGSGSSTIANGRCSGCGPITRGTCARMAASRAKAGTARPPYGAGAMPGLKPSVSAVLIVGADGTTMGSAISETMDW